MPQVKYFKLQYSEYNGDKKRYEYNHVTKKALANEVLPLFSKSCPSSHKEFLAGNAN